MSSLNLNDVNRLMSELASFARTGVPIPEGLKQLHASLPEGQLKVLAAETEQSVRQGTPLSEALSSSSVQVPAAFVALVRCSEISGDLAASIDFGLKYSRRLKQYKTSTATIMIYPLLIFIVLLAITGVTTALVVPQFRSIYDQLGAELPTPTRMVIGFSEFMRSGGVVVLLGLLGLAIYLLIMTARDQLPMTILRFIPGVRKLTYLGDTAIMTEFVGHLVERGVPLPEACKAASLMVHNPDMRASLESMAAASESGATTAEHLNENVPATAAWLYQQGEQRGTLVDACAGIAGYCESRFDLLSRRMLFMLEPLIILVIAVVCGFAVVALYLPLFNIPRFLS